MHAVKMFSNSIPNTNKFTGNKYDIYEFKYSDKNVGTVNINTTHRNNAATRKHDVGTDKRACSRTSNQGPPTSFSTPTSLRKSQAVEDADSVLRRSLVSLADLCLLIPTIHCTVRAQYISAVNTINTNTNTETNDNTNTNSDKLSLL